MSAVVGSTLASLPEAAVPHLPVLGVLLVFFFFGAGSKKKTRGRFFGWLEMGKK